MKITIDLGKLLNYYDEHSHSYNLSDGNGFRAFMMDFLVEAEDEQKRNDEYVEEHSCLLVIRFKSRENAEAVLRRMKDTIKDRGWVTVADYYRYANQTPEISFYNMGWPELQRSYVYSFRDADGEEVFCIYLPRPMRIERL